MTTLVAHVANCLMGGDEATHQSDGSWIRDTVRFKCGKWEFSFRQRADVVTGKASLCKGAFCETSTVEIECVDADLPRVLEALDVICWLLSFAGQCRVIWYRYEFPAGSSLGYSKSVIGTAEHFRPPLDLHDTAAVKSFVEQTYPVFCKIHKRRKLSAVIEYLIQADRPHQPTEIRLLLMFVTLESLKDTYARDKRIPYVDGFYRKPPIKPGKVGAKFSFVELLQLSLHSVGMRRGLKQVVALRNEIIHSGLSRKAHSRQWQMYERVQDLVREYLFRLLGYRGAFLTYASRGTKFKKI